MEERIYVILDYPESGVHLCGKTLLVAKCLLPIQRDLAGQMNGLFLWLTPTNAIFSQTYDALRNRNHPYRQAIDQDFNNKVQVFRKSDRITRLDIQDKLEASKNRAFCGTI